MTSQLIIQIESAREICKNSNNSLANRLIELNALRITVSGSIGIINEKFELNLTKKTNLFKVQASNESEFSKIYAQIMTYASKAILLMTEKIVEENTEFLNKIKISSFVAENSTESEQSSEIKEKKSEKKSEKKNNIEILQEDGLLIEPQFFDTETDEPQEQSTKIFDGTAVPNFLIPQKNIGPGLIAVEGPGESRKFFADDQDSLNRTIDFLDECEGTCEPLHEVIGSKCRFYCDLDDKISSLSRAEFMEKINIMHHYFNTFFKQYYQLSCKIIVNFYAAFSENPNYNSAHIYIDVISESIEKFAIIKDGTYQYLITEKPTDQYPFWRKFDQALQKISHYGPHSIIDFSVYKNNAQLRLPGTRKGGYLLKPYDENIVSAIVGHGKISNVEPTYDYRHNFCANFNEVKYYKQFIVLPSAEPAENKKFNTEYEKILFERILQRSELIIPPLGKKDKNSSGKDSIFKAAAFRIFCFYHRLRDEIIKKNISNFFASRTQGKRDTIEEEKLLGKLIFKWRLDKKFCNYGLSNHRQFFKYREAKPIIVETNRLKYGNFTGITCIKSGTGTGKTYGFIEKYKNNRCLYISCKISLADEFQRTAAKQGVPMTHYNESDAKNIISVFEKDGTVPQHFCVQINSLHKYVQIIGQYEYIFIDESEAIFGCFSHILETAPRNMPATRAAFFEIMKKNVIFCSANMGENTFMFIEDYGLPYVFIKNIKKDKEGYKATECTHKGFFAKLEYFIENGKRVAISCNSKKMAIEIEFFIKKIKNEAKVLKQTSLDDKVDISLWKNYDFLVHTSTIETGVSFVDEHFDYLMGYFKSGINTYDSCYQMLFRVRFPKNKEIFLYCHSGKKLEYADRMDEIRASRHIDFQLRSDLKNSDKDAKFNEFAYEKSRDPIDRVLLRNIFTKNYSDTYFKYLLKRELVNAGIEFEKKKYDQKFMTKTVAEEKREHINSEVMKSKNIQFYFNMMGIKAEEFEMPKIKNNISIETVIARAYSLYRLNFSKNRYSKAEDTDIKLNFKEIAATYFLELRLKFADSTASDETWNTELAKIFEEKYEALAACFGKRKYSLAEMLKKDLQRKIQFAAPILNSVGFELKKINGQYCIYEMDDVNFVLKMADNHRDVYNNRMQAIL